MISALRLAERRLRKLEDQAEILRIVASFGPCADSLDGDGLAALWSEDGVYDFGGVPLRGEKMLRDLVDLPSHRAFVETGCAHVLSLPRIDVDGDRAVAVNYSRVYVRAGDGWEIARVSANRWDLVRCEHGWRVESRRTRLVDEPEAWRLLHR